MNQYMQLRYPYLDTVSFSNISEDAIQLVWNRTLTNFQREVILRLLMMRSAPNKPEVKVLVQGTGTEKSTVVQIVGCILNKLSLLLWISVPR